MKLLRLFPVLFLLGALSADAQNRSYSQAIKLSRDSVLQFMKRSHVAGAAVTVSIDGKVVWSEGFGFADLEQRVPVDPAKTKFRIASISKSLTATGLALLYQERKIQLDSSLYYYLPDFPKKKYRPTLRQLAGHTAGVRAYLGDEFFISQRYASVAAALHVFDNDSLLFEPGTKYNYSSYGFNLLSAAMEKASGKDFLTFMRDRVLKPLQLKNTVPDFNDSIVAYRSRYYEVEGTGWRNSRYVDNSYKWAGGGFLSTSTDMTKFANAYIHPGIFNAETIALFTRSQTLANGKETGYGLGWASAVDRKNHRWFGHSGGAVGGTSRLVIYPKEKIAVAILTNITGAKMNDLPNSIADLFMP
jgi:serine beta-lactamase-like protein LACTB